MSSERELFPVIDDAVPSPCCGGETAPGAEEDEELSPAGLPWLAGKLPTPAGSVPVIVTRLQLRDTVGNWKARWGWGRMRYRVPAGLYAVGEPGAGAPVLVTANYKMSFDALRRELPGQSLWLLVLDTKGVNVWCAAGKGTFGTAELVRRIAKTRLQEVVSHCTVILPQLGAPGISAHAVRRQTGFKVVYGPVRAADLPAFLQAGQKTTPQMRQVRFNLVDRLVSAPVELAALGKPLLLLLAALILLNLLSAFFDRSAPALLPLIGEVASDLLPLLCAALAGTVLTPLLLPCIPGRAFAWKGWLLGILWAAAFVFLIAPETGWLKAAGYLLLLPAVSAFLAINFTGSSTYTSMSGVLKEMGVALPVIIITASLGAAALITTYFLQP